MKKIAFGAAAAIVLTLTTTAFAQDSQAPAT